MKVSDGIHVSSFGIEKVLKMFFKAWEPCEHCNNRSSRYA